MGSPDCNYSRIVHNVIVMKRLLSTLMAGGILVSTLPTSGISLSFTNITNNSPSIGDDLNLLVVDGGGGTVDFLFSKTGISSGFIAQIYFEDGNSQFSVIDFDVALSSVSAVFDDPATPPDPPGLPFTTDYSFDANNPAPTWGVSTGETAGFTGTLTGGATFGDVESALTEGALRVALHAQGLAAGASDTYLGVPDDPDDPPLPEPSSALLSGLGMLLLCLLRKRT